MRAIRLALPLTLTLTLLGAPLACSSPQGGDLFAKDGLASGAVANAGGSFGAAAGTDSAGSQSQGSGGASLGGSSSGGSGSGGSGSADKGGSSLGGSGGSGGQEHQPQVIESCDMLEGAVTNEDNGHCYRINDSSLTFAAARDACSAAGGYLVSVTSEAEDDFVHALLEADHWLGASDGRGDASEGVGSYTWLSGDEWDYSNWVDGQPNAVATNCADEDSGANCFEHCAYQEESGGWIDRGCWHTIASICEWEPMAKQPSAQ